MIERFVLFFYLFFSTWPAGDIAAIAGLHDRDHLLNPQIPLCISEKVKCYIRNYSEDPPPLPPLSPLFLLTSERSNHNCIPFIDLPD